MGKSEDLIKLAENDLKVAVLVLNSANDELMQNTAAYHVEQAVEKVMKGLIVKAGGNAGVSHSIVELSKDLDELKVLYPDWIHDKDDDITSWSTTIRYNANFKSDHDEIQEVIELTGEWIRSISDSASSSHHFSDGDNDFSISYPISIQRIGITKLDTDAIVNAANEDLWEGGGVCGAIFREAGSAELTKACEAIGGCKTGSAVITPGFKLKAKHIIHAVGPVWKDGNHHEPQDLYGCYTRSLELCKENNLHSIGFPLISAGIFGYPKDKAWRKAIQACKDFVDKNPDYDIQIIFAVLDNDIKMLGEETLKELLQER